MHRLTTGVKSRRVVDAEHGVAMHAEPHERDSFVVRYKVIVITGAWYRYIISFPQVKWLMLNSQMVNGRSGVQIALGFLPPRHLSKMARKPWISFEYSITWTFFWDIWHPQTSW
jgi:hypothetical protein